MNWKNPECSHKNLDWSASKGVYMCGSKWNELFLTSSEFWFSLCSSELMSTQSFGFPMWFRTPKLRYMLWHEYKRCMFVIWPYINCLYARNLLFCCIYTITSWIYIYILGWFFFNILPIRWLQKKPPNGKRQSPLVETPVIPWFHQKRN